MLKCSYFLYTTAVNDLGGKLMCVGNELFCREKFRKLLTWAEQNRKPAEFPVSCTQPAVKLFLQSSGTDAERIVRKGDFGSQLTSCRQTQMENPEPEKIASRKFITSILSEVEKLCKLFFQSETSGKVSPENCACVRKSVGWFQAFYNTENPP